MNDNKTISSMKSEERRGQRPVAVFRDEKDKAISASVWERRNTQSSGSFFAMTLSRSYRMNEKEGYSNSFYARNAEAMIECISKASAFIVQKESEKTAQKEGRSQIESMSREERLQVVRDMMKDAKQRNRESLKDNQEVTKRLKSKP